LPEGEDGMDATAATGQVVPRGLLLDRYQPVRRLGTGAFGTVWLARDERLGRQVAIKVVPVERLGPARPGADRGWREAIAAARLSHPAIVALYEAARDADAAYLVSEWVRGSPLSALLAEGALSDRDVAEIGLALAGALAHAHERGVVHRDVKPGNVLVPEEQRPGAPPAKLCDFGVAHVTGGDPLTVTGDVVGTLAYMAPEQAEGRRVTPVADVYALALVLYEGWTGDNPVRAATPAATARRLGEPLPPLALRRPDLPGALGEALDTALHPDPDFRLELPELREALAAALPALGDDPGWTRPRDAPAPTPTPTRRVPPLPLLRRQAPRGGRKSSHDGRGAIRAGQPVVWDELDEPRRARQLPVRVVAAVSAGGLASLGTTFLDAPGVAPAVALAAAVCVFLLPRLAWLVGALVAVGWVFLHLHEHGAAFVLAAALAAPPVLLPRAPALWSLPALAPLLGLLGLAPAAPALAALARTPVRRAALAALAAWWLLLAEPLARRELLGGPLPAPGWRRALAGALDNVLRPLLQDPRLGLVVLWAVAAALLPLTARTHRVLGPLVWALALAAATASVASVPIALAALAAGVAAVGVSSLAWPSAPPRTP